MFNRSSFCIDRSELRFNEEECSILEVQNHGSFVHCQVSARRGSDDEGIEVVGEKVVEEEEESDEEMTGKLFYFSLSLFKCLCLNFCSSIAK